jgi:dTDP-4-amino-4,6-dideoxygalactose transaminase
MLSQQARDPQPHYEHTTYGYNYRMSNVIAAIGRGQLRCLDERVRRRREIFAFYREALSGLPGIELMPEAAEVRSNRWLTVILVTPAQFGGDRETIRLALERENIESRPVWKPMHLQPVFDCDGRCEGAPDPTGLRDTLLGNRTRARVVGGAVSEDLFARGLCLPSGTSMTEDDLRRVVATIAGCRKGTRPAFERRVHQVVFDPDRERRIDYRA